MALDWRWRLFRDRPLEQQHFHLKARRFRIVVLAVFAVLGVHVGGQSSPRTPGELALSSVLAASLVRTIVAAAGAVAAVAAVAADELGVDRDS